MLTLRLGTELVKPVLGGCYTNGPMKGITSRAVFVIASDRRERGNPVLLLETWGLDRHVPRIKCGVLAMT